MLGHVALSTALILSSLIAVVSGLLCKCDICTNNTCETDGYCFASTTRDKATGIIKHDYRCVDREQFFLPDVRPMQCDPQYSPPTTDFAMLCCHIKNYCNIDLNPQLVQDKSHVTTPGNETHVMAVLQT
uniref:Activin types I and II receptor domain-containing protein n=1 Tax=Cacopsylla melanoneura TaxID=428564 RepID=A0A8D9A1W8_9HEMI